MTHQISILIIEDESAIRDMLKFSLSHENFALYEAEDSQQAEAILFDHPIDLVLLDWMLPGKTGIEIAKQLKKVL